eukprot:TRINITY_DN1674_c0_g1_i2.p1 TRINITY_DN1674_c0_g1~~TRINITY_DN1674_c0_g1_i2.p1  ORF type:complete len:193 (+),score=43.04 TRINITY_DN1674_c0_g1_i2:53-631(+)
MLLGILLHSVCQSVMAAREDVVVEGFHVKVSLGSLLESAGVADGCIATIEERIPKGVILDRYELQRMGLDFEIKNDDHLVIEDGRYLERSAEGMNDEHEFNVAIHNISAGQKGKEVFLPLHTRYQTPSGKESTICLSNTTITSSCLQKPIRVPPACWTVPTADPNSTETVSVATASAVWISAIVCSLLSILK